MGLVAPRDVKPSWTRNQDCVLCIGRQILIHCTTREVLQMVFMFLFKGFLAIIVPAPILGIFIENFFHLCTICSPDRISRVPVISYFGCGIVFSITFPTLHCVFLSIFSPFKPKRSGTKKWNTSRTKNHFLLLIQFLLWLGVLFSPFWTMTESVTSPVSLTLALISVFSGEEKGDCAFFIVAWYMWSHCNKK